MDFKVSGSCIMLAALIFVVVVVVQVESLMACSFVSSVLHLFCQHRSPLFLEVCLILFT